MIKILLLLSSFSAFSQVRVIVAEPDLDPAPLGREYVVEKKVEREFPSREKREEALKKFYVPASWTELQKDIFYSDLQRKSSSELEEKYPSIRAR